jgi:hypothetical protein
MPNYPIGVRYYSSDYVSVLQIKGWRLIHRAYENKPEIGTSRKQASDVSIRAKAGRCKKHRMSVPEALSGATSCGTEMTQERSFIALSLIDLLTTK